MTTAFDWTNDRTSDETNGAYRKKGGSVDIVAFRYNDPHFLPGWVLDYSGWMPTEDGPLFINTTKGTKRTELGDWIICSVDGDIYPCKHEVFCKTYDLVELQPSLTEGDEQ